MIFNSIFLYSIVSLLSRGSLASTSGSNRITTHYYHKDAPFLDTNPVMCGFLGSHMDLNRVTAVQDLTGAECGSCLKVTGNNKVVYVMAVDRGGQGLDINMSSFKELFGEETGRFDASWEVTDSGNCAGIITGGDYNIPGLRSIPSPKKNDEPKVKQEVKQEVQPEVKPEVQPEAKKEIKEEAKPEASNSDKDVTCKGFEMKCLGGDRFVQCVHNTPFIISCAKGTKCENKGSFVTCA